jgi:hypothetical protein
MKRSPVFAPEDLQANACAFSTALGLFFSQRPEILDVSEVLRRSTSR